MKSSSIFLYPALDDLARKKSKRQSQYALKFSLSAGGQRMVTDITVNEGFRQFLCIRLWVLWSERNQTDSHNVH